MRNLLPAYVLCSRIKCYTINILSLFPGSRMRFFLSLFCPKGEKALAMGKSTLQDTGIHPCSCKSQSLPAPDTHLTNTEGRVLCHTCMTRWVGRGGAGIRCFSIIHLRLNRPSIYTKSNTPNSDQFRGIWGPPSENKNKSWHKTDCCNVLSDCC
jgi:hypothetical protein